MNGGHEDGRGRFIDVTVAGAPMAGANAPAAGSGERVWIGVRYECCGTYTRVYRRLSDSQYRGRCPRCGAGIVVRVGPNGVQSRILIATPVAD